MKLLNKFLYYINIHIYFMFVITAFIIDHFAVIVEKDQRNIKDSKTLAIIIVVVLFVNLTLYILSIANKAKNNKIIKKVENNDYTDVDIEHLYKNFRLEFKLVWINLLLFLIFVIVYIRYILFLSIYS